jgi:hypothetical protein
MTDVKPMVSEKKPVDTVDLRVLTGEQLIAASS